MSAPVTELAITAQYQCSATLRELADSVFLRRMAESIVKAFTDSLIGCLEPAAGVLAIHRILSAG